MDLGNFSVSLSVKDIGKSRAFYEALGFEEIAGNIDHKWLILKNGDGKIGLFEGMFEENLMTFNPLDVRAVEAKLKEAGITLDKETEGTEGPTHLSLKDPDGNQILMDQHL